MGKTADTLLELAKVWMDFSTGLSTVPFVQKLERGKLRLEDYHLLLLNHRQQVIEGSRWIARAASSVESEYADLRSTFLKHAVTEHRDYRMLEENFVASGGKREDILTYEKNIGTEALHGFMMHRASLTNPFDLLGAMFIIEGMGRNKAGSWGEQLQAQLGLHESQVSFLTYHAANDEDHLQEFEETLNSGILNIPDMGKRMVKTAKIVARLYRLQLEELGQNK